jgi:hypothetical protein
MKTIFKKIIWIFLVLSCFIKQADANSPELEQFDLRFYSPVNYGLKDLVFEARISNLTETLNAQQSLGKLVDVHFKIFWMFPDKFQVEVMGLPAGFNELKYELRQMIIGRLDFVVPESLGPRFKAYNFTKEQVGNETVLKGTDPTNKQDIGELALHFDNRGKITKMVSKTPVGTNTSSLTMNAKSWSHSKWVLEEMRIQTLQGVQSTDINHKISYTTQGGMGFPSKIDITTTYELKINVDDKENKQTQSVDSYIEFKNYEVNTGKAKRFMADGIKS